MLRHFPSPANPSAGPLTVDLPPSLAAAIERAVEREGGDDADALDLAEVWVRVLRDSERRAGGIRATVRFGPCSCADGGVLDGDGRCERCVGVLASGANPDHVPPTGGGGGDA